MSIGEQINSLRKRNSLSQDDFANMFHVSRQTISNWENGKSYPDLEMIIKISNYFKISVDELLKNDTKIVEKIDDEKRKKRKYFILLIVICVIGSALILILYNKYQERIAVNFSMKKHETYKSTEIKELSLNVANGYFSVPKNEKLDVQVHGVTDDVKLHLTIMNQDNNIYYLLDGQELNDLQTLYFEKGSYIIQIVADDFTEDIISIEYNIDISN